jgi:ketopantoate reductase
MANDLDAGNRLELDWLAGRIVALGRKYGVFHAGEISSA